MKRNEKNGVVYFTFENLETTGMVRHGFSSRVGGISQGHFASMNLGFSTGDNSETVKENRRIFCSAVGFDYDKIVGLKQIHSTDIVSANKTPLPTDMQGDGLITDFPGITLVTYYADCVPLLFFDPTRRVIANCHAGWRGTAHNMAGKAVQKMMADYGCNPRDILAGIGPSISCKNFEVGSEVVHEFKNLLPFSTEFMYNSKSKFEKYHIDLWGINKQSLITEGVPEENIEMAELCTFDDETHFYSHRRNGSDRGSLAAFIEIVEG